ncbi:MAG: flagellar protein FlgN [Clostridiales bacterium]|nr:flagellar protein FlgN [Clostridiales bacterium]
MSIPDSLFEFFKEYAQFLEEMESVQKEKLESVLSGDLQRMERSIKSQQAYAMRLENIENRRLRLQKEAGFADMTFSQLLEHAEPYMRNELRELFYRAQNAFANIKHFNEKALSITREKLRTLELDGAGSSPFNIETNA